MRFDLIKADHLVGTQEHGNADAPAQELGTIQAAVVGRLICRNNSNIPSFLAAGAADAISLSHSIPSAWQQTRLEMALRSQASSVLTLCKVFPTIRRVCLNKHRRCLYAVILTATHWQTMLIDQPDCRVREQKRTRPTISGLEKRSQPWAVIPVRRSSY